MKGGVGEGGNGGRKRKRCGRRDKGRKEEREAFWVKRKKGDLTSFCLGSFLSLMKAYEG
jgi:hypothetical protein